MFRIPQRLDGIEKILHENAKRLEDEKERIHELDKKLVETNYQLETQKKLDAVVSTLSGSVSKLNEKVESIERKVSDAFSSARGVAWLISTLFAVGTIVVPVLTTWYDHSKDASPINTHPDTHGTPLSKP